MQILTKADILKNKEFYLEEITSGKIFIYPTDTIYGIGCNARLPDSVKKIREIKQRASNPFSIISPNREWIDANCRVNEAAREWLKKLPGPYTIIIPLKNMQAIAPETISGLTAVGIRMPNHWFSELITESFAPFITTSVNIAGQPHVKNIAEIPDEIKVQVDYIIDDGELNNPPSTIVEIKENEIIIKERN